MGTARSKRRVVQKKGKFKIHRSEGAPLPAAAGPCHEEGEEGKCREVRAKKRRTTDLVEDLVGVVEAIEERIGVGTQELTRRHDHGPAGGGTVLNNMSCCSVLKSIRPDVI